MIYVEECPIFTVNTRYDAVGTVKKWERDLYTDVVVNGMSKEEAMEKHEYSSYGNFGRKRFDQVYDSYIEMYNAKTGNDAMGKKIADSTKWVYILIALCAGLGIALIFIYLFNKK